jgi:hypothetical protein
LEEKTLGTKISIAAIWSEPPNIRFPPFFTKLIDLEKAYEEMCDRVEWLKDRLEKRKDEEQKKRAEKQQA